MSVTIEHGLDDLTAAFDKNHLADLVQPVGEAAGATATQAEVCIADISVKPEGSGGIF